MPNYNTGYWNFKSYNVFDVESLSSYALPQTPVRFVPGNYETSDFSNKYILWDFGDGSTKVNSFSAEHYFYYPGTYSVTMTLMLSSGNTVLDSYRKDIQILDFVSNSFRFKPFIGKNSLYLYLTAGNASPQLTLERYNSLQTYGNKYSFFLNASGSNSLYYDITKLEKEPYSHLLPTNRFFKRENITLETGSVFSDTIVNKVDTIDTNLYGRLNQSTLVEPTSSSDKGAFFVGTSGSADFYFVDDTVNNSTYHLLATVDTTNFPDNYTKYYNLKYDSDLPVKNSDTAKYSVFENIYKQPDFIHISSNGIDGEGKKISTFNINPSKFLDQQISFVAKTKFNSWYDSKTIPTNFNYNFDFAENAIHIKLITADKLTLVSELTEYVSFDTELFKNYRLGWVKGSFVFPTSAYKLWNNNNIDSTKQMFRLSAYMYTDNFSLSGTSYAFHLYPSSGVNKVAKINENFDMSTYMKDLAFQPSIYKRPQIFDSFFGTILGTLSSETNAIGKRIYEKTSNFIQNNVNIDTCDIKNLYGYALEYNVDLDDFASSNLLINYPADLSRLVNIFSIKKSLLFGKRSQYQLNFNDKYNLADKPNDTYNAAKNYRDGKIYGNNLGDRLDIMDGIIYKNEDYIVGYETFSERYTLLRTNVNTIPTSSYALSSFDKSWGWGLVLPNDFYDQSNFVYELSSYYKFYRFVPVVPGDWTNNIINWDDVYQTTIDLEGENTLSAYLPSYMSNYNIDTSPLKNWDSYAGVIEQNLNYQLSIGLELLSAS